MTILRVESEKVLSAFEEADRTLFAFTT